MVVFKILNKVSGQHYVGSCRSSIDERWELYLRAAEAGLDFPLYKEIREHGEALFSIDELDFADEISELKEMELLHTIELGARSLRNYKFGLTDAVVKRIRQVDHERAWMKDLPEEPLRHKRVLAPAPKAKTKAKPKPTLSGSRSATAPAVAQSLVLPRPPLETAAVESTPRDASAELDKALFAEGIGLLVRALASVEQLSCAQQQTKAETLSLSRALAESERALQRLQVQQDEVALKARLAMEAVALSQSANALLIDAQLKARSSALSALEALDRSSDVSLEAAQLQQEFSRLLMRIKTGVSSSKTVLPAPVKVAQNPLLDEKIEACLTRTELAQDRYDHSVAEVPSPQQVEEAKMVNRLKQLDRMLTSDLSVIDSGQAEVDSDLPCSPLSVKSPARAWVGTLADDAESALVLVNRSTPATVIHRRSKTVRSVSNAAVLGRKTLSIKVP